VLVASDLVEAKSARYFFLSSTHEGSTVDNPTAVIAEDEPLLRGELREALTKLWPDLHICAEATDGIEALQAVERH
jgi:hypothetical protein